MNASAPETGIIPPEAVAYKLFAWRNFRTPKFAGQAKALPRLPELAWFIQAQSLRPGGLENFVVEFLAAFPDRLCTPSMSRYGAQKQTYTGEERRVIMYEVPRCYDYTKDAQARSVASEFWRDVEVWERGDSEARPNLARRSKLNRAEFSSLCHKAALNHLAQHLRAFCGCACNPKDPAAHEERNERLYGEDGPWTQEDVPLADVWYFQDLAAALIEYLDTYARQASRSLVMTKVACQCFDAAEYAWAEKALVVVEGQTRFGKTYSMSTFAGMHPGRARLFRVPCSNSEYDLFAAIAEAIGLEATLKTTFRELKTKVEFVIRHGGLMLIGDESHFLLPTRFSKDTAPARLNWIRTRIIDHGCPLVLITTPQDFKQCVSRFIRATGHNINQFLGRKLLTVQLPTTLEESDLRAVARHHFPDLDGDYTDLIIAKAGKSAAYFMAVESIAKRVRFIARRQGRAAITMEDLRAAITEVAPESAPPRPAPAPAAARPHPIAVKRTRPLSRQSGAAADAPALPAPVRGVTPAPEPSLEAPVRETTPSVQSV